MFKRGPPGHLPLRAGNCSGYAAGFRIGKRATSFVIFFGGLLLASVCQAQISGKVDPEAAEITTELVGAAVFDADGRQVGEVAEVATDDEGRPMRIRMRAGAILGFRADMIELPPNSFAVLRGAVVVDLPAEAVSGLLGVTEPVTEN